MSDLPLEEQSQELTDGKKKSKKLFCILVVISILFILAILSFLIILILNKGNIFNFSFNNILNLTVNSNTKVNVGTEDDPYLGGKDAKIVIVEFADFQCPYCHNEFPIIRELVNTYGDRIKFIFRDLPATENHPDAQNASEAAECAHEQGKFWEMHDKLFINYQYLDVASLKNYAKELGLDENKFNDCLDNHKYRDEVLEDLAEGISAGVTATPAFFINGEIIEGSVPLDYFKVEIDQLLNSLDK